MDLSLNADRFTGDEYVNIYDTFRPKPPENILQLALNYLNKSKASKVLDLGCGTGISTEVWNEYADKVIGLEPSEEMLAIATDKNKNPKIKYINGYSNEVPLSTNSIDIVACSQSFHWMEPKSTLQEVNRLLIKGGVLVIYDIIWPPSVNYAYENAYNELFENIGEITSQLNQKIAVRWNKNEHLANVKRTNYFKLCKETYFHKLEELTKEKLIGIALSQGGLEALLKRGYSNDDIGLTKFKETVRQLKYNPIEKITYNYRVVYAIK